MSINSEDVSQRLDLALDASGKAGELILQHYQTAGLQVDLKGDQSPVTVADRGAEELLREQIAQKFPDDGILGEEFESKESANGFRWILDPIDGTKSFIHGVPLFGTLIGLEHNERVVMGVCRFPALDEVVYASEGQGTWWQIGDADPKQTHVSEVAEFSQALFCTTTITGWDKIDRRETFHRLSSNAGLARGWSDCYGHILVATGRAEVMVDPEMSPWDAAALVPIAQEAGGHFIDWNGQPTIYSNNGVSVNAKLKDRTVELLAD